jgi:response regulator of citrate/malate metabolism
VTKKEIIKLSELLMSQPVTAADVAKVMGCGKPTAYRRIRQLRKRARLEIGVLYGRSGPGAKTYMLVSDVS